MALVFCLPAAAVAEPNPLGQLFKGLDRGLRELPEAIERERRQRDQFDLRPIQRPEDSRNRQQAEKLLLQERWHDGIEILQHLLDQPSDAFFFGQPNNLLSLQSDVEERLSKLPEEGRRQYENRYAAPARQLLQEALDRQDQQLLSAVSRRFLLTPAGRDALLREAALLLDRGEEAAAARAWLRVATRIEFPAERQALQRRAIRLLASAGRVAEARRLTEQLLPDDRDLLATLSTMRSGAAPAAGAAVSPFLLAPQAYLVDPEPLPTLLPHWSAELIERFAVQEQVERLGVELREQGRTLLPTSMPLIVDGRIVFRSLRSLQARDLTTGEVLWEDRMADSPEALFAPGIGAPQQHDFLLNAEQGWQYEQHQLTTLLYRDGVYGSLSSDGRNLYAINGQGKGTLRARFQLWDRGESSEDSSAWASNQLSAYDLATGRVRWTLGGPELEQSFSLPLAGVFFLGPPLPDGDELFVIGEYAGDVLLFCLSAESGEELWSQPLATPGRPIAQDVVRRLWPCQPAAAGELLLCPTTCGWLTAVDRSTRRLVWTQRFAPRSTAAPRQFRGGYSMQALLDLNRRWHDAALFVSGEHVLVAPPELPDELGMTQPTLCCLDLRTGEKIWEHPKGDALYVAGVWRQEAVLVGAANVLCRRLETRGEARWNVSLPQAPTGRGVIVNGTLWLPAEKGTLLAIDLEEGELRRESMRTPEGIALGNLAVAAGRLASLSVTSVTVFPTTSELLSELQREGEESLQLREAKLALANGNPREAATILERIRDEAALPAELRQDLATTRWEALVQLVTAVDADAEALLDRLASLADTPERRFEQQRLVADFLADGPDAQAATNAYLTLLMTAPRNERVEDGTRIVRIDSWIGGRLERLYEALPIERRADWATQVAEELAGFSELSQRRDQLARALAFHPIGIRLELELGREAHAAGQAGVAILRWRRAAAATDPQLQREALGELGQLYSRLGWHADADRCWTAALATAEESEADSENTWREPLLRQRQATREALADSVSVADWGRQWRVHRTGAAPDREGLMSAPTCGGDLAFLSSLRFLVDLANPNQRLQVESRGTGEFLTSLPLRRHPASSHHAHAAVRLTGPLSLVLHRGVLHAIAWPEGEVAWTWSPTVSSRGVNAHLRSQSGMQQLNAFLGSQKLRSGNHSQTGFLVAATERAILVLARDWIALDPLTGEELWRDREGAVRGSAHAFGAHRFITGNDLDLRRAIDGSIEEDAELGRLMQRALRVEGEELLLLEIASDSQGDPLEWRLRRVDRQGRDAWSVSLPVTALANLPDSQTLFWMDPQQTQAGLVDLTTGATSAVDISGLETIDSKHQYSLLADEGRYYLIADEGAAHVSYLNLLAVRVAGTVQAFDRSGRTLWSKTIQGRPTRTRPRDDSPPRGGYAALNLLIQDLSENPLLLLVGERPDHSADLHFRRLHLLGLDKATGETVIDWERSTEAGGLNYMQVDSAQRLIELRTYNERLLLLPAAPEPAP